MFIDLVVCNYVLELLFSIMFSFEFVLIHLSFMNKNLKQLKSIMSMIKLKDHPRLTYNSDVTLENSPFSNFVFQKIGFISSNPWWTQPSSLTWYRLM